MRRGQGDRGAFPPLERAELVSLACSPPKDSGLERQRWTVRDLSVEAMLQRGVQPIHYSTVSRILAESDMKPHRVMYWLHSQDPQFREKAASILWYYERAVGLGLEGIAVVCLDEKPSIQALGRKYPDVPGIPGRITRREFEYVRHGTVNLSLSMEVVSGRISGGVIDTTNRWCFIERLEQIVEEFDDCERVELILDNASSHTARDTMEWFKKHRQRIRPHFTPTHASWLNQAELALSAFSRKYLKGAVVSSREDLMERIWRGIVEYNALYAKPFNWSFTRHAMHDWWTRYQQHQKN